MAATIPSVQLEYYENHASDNQQPNLIATIVLCLVLPCIAVFLRFLARWKNHVGYKADDWLILLALVCSMSLDFRSEGSFAKNNTASTSWYVYNYRPWCPLR